VLSSHAVWEHIEALRREGITILLATNYLDEADRLCDRLLIIDHGKVVVGGTPEALKASVGADVVSVELETGGDELAAALSRHPVVKQAIVSGNSVQAYVADAATFLPAVVRIADDLGLRPGAVTYKRPSLDDVFLLHTGRQLREGI
jgi:ABC-2 type transport system ATP-binding protein